MWGNNWISIRGCKLQLVFTPVRRTSAIVLKIVTTVWLHIIVCWGGHGYSQGFLISAVCQSRPKLQSGMRPHTNGKASFECLVLILGLLSFTNVVDLELDFGTGNDNFSVEACFFTVERIPSLNPPFLSDWLLPIVDGTMYAPNSLDTSNCSCAAYRLTLDSWLFRNRLLAVVGCWSMVDYPSGPLFPRDPHPSSTHFLYIYFCEKHLILGIDELA